MQGRELVELKKVLKEVKEINNGLVEKQRLINVGKSKKNRLNPKEIHTTELVTGLIARQGELEYQKRVNMELTQRMENLTEVEESQEDLDQQLVRNADQLLLQQNKLKKMEFMKTGIKKQRQIIAEL